jgi:uncharacterized coiled-coil protein SlyX
MGKKVNKEEPTFDKQLEKYSEENQNEDDPIFSHAYQEFLVKLLKTRDKAIISEVIEFVADNETFAEKVANKVRGDIADSYIALERILSEIKTGQVVILKNISQINDRLSIAEERVNIQEQRIEDHEKRLAVKRLRIEKLEVQMSFLQPDSIKSYTDEIRKVKPILNKVVKMFSWWRIAIYVLIVAILASLMVLILHKNGYLSIFKSDRTVKNEWVDKLKADQSNGYSGNTRGGNIVYPLSDVQIDSLENEQIKSLIK